MAKSKKYYVVWVGQNPGIYNSWTDCQLQIKGFPNAKYKSFKTRVEAENAYNDGVESHIISKTTAHGTVKKANYLSFKDEINFNTIAVDAACSGNPGIMEYRGVDTGTGEQLFLSRKYKGGTNNIGEFLAIVHGLAYLKKMGQPKTPIYTDSRTALAWVKNQFAKTTLNKNKSNELLFLHLSRATNWLKSNQYSNEIIKWDTKRWGEIPADFGRK